MSHPGSRGHKLLPLHFEHEMMAELSASRQAEGGNLPPDGVLMNNSFFRPLDFRFPKITDTFHTESEQSWGK